MVATFTTDLDIMNAALKKLGEKQQISTSDKTNAAMEMRSSYRLVLDRLIRAYDWNCCIKEDFLALKEKLKNDDRPYVYALPADCLRIISLNGIVTGYSGTERHERYDPLYKIRGNQLFTKLPAPLKVEYSYRNEDVSTYDPCFCDVLAFDLAIENCERISQSSSKLNDLRQLRRESINTALRTNSLEIPARPKATGNWLRARQVRTWGEL